MSGRVEYVFNAMLHTQDSGAGSNGLQRFKNGLLRPFGLEDRLVIGEDMALRVTPYADGIGADYYGGLAAQGQMRST